MEWWMYIFLFIWVGGWIALAVWALATTWEQGAFEVVIAGLPLALFGFLWPALVAVCAPFWLLMCAVDLIMSATYTGPYGSAERLDIEIVRNKHAVRRYEYLMKNLPE